MAAADVAAALGGLDEVVLRAATAGLREVGDEVVEVARDNAPFDTGALRRSGRVRGPRTQQLDVTVTFGGPSTPHDVDYAAAVEALDANYVVGGSRYLGRALDEVRPRAAEVVARRVQGELRRWRP